MSDFCNTIAYYVDQWLLVLEGFVRNPLLALLTFFGLT